MIGFFVGVSSWPPRWYLRGPLIGVLVMFPVTFLPLAMPECGARCMGANLTTGAALGLAVAGLAFAITRRHRA